MEDEHGWVEVLQRADMCSLQKNVCHDEAIKLKSMHLLRDNILTPNQLSNEMAYGLEKPIHATTRLFSSHKMIKVYLFLFLFFYF